MALIWDWNKRIGTATVVSPNTKTDHKVNLYEGNAFLIAIYEFTQDGIEKYELCWFFADKDHAKNCLGLSKGYKNIFDDWYFKRLDFDKPEYGKNCIEVIKLFLKAYPNLSITIN